MVARPVPTDNPTRRRTGGFRSVDDARRILAEVNTAGLDRANTALARQLLRPADEAALSHPDAARVLPAVEEIRGLLPWPGGIRRGATVSVVGSTSLLLTLLAGALRHGSDAAVVGMPDLGALAALADYQIPGQRLALVPAPGPDWATIVGALIDGVDLVAVATPPGAAETTLRALMHRARQRGCVLLPTSPWPGGDLTIELVERRWSGLGPGRGRLRRQDVTLRSLGRGRAARARTLTTALPPASITGVSPSAVAPIPPAPPDRYEPPTPARARPASADPWRSLFDRLPRMERSRR